MGLTFCSPEEVVHQLVKTLNISIAIQVAPFGGVKQSGLGREGSKYGIDEYLEVSMA